MTPLSHNDSFASIDSLAQVNHARECIAALREALMKSSPDELMACLPGLSDAAGRLSAVEREVRSSSPAADELTRALKGLKSDLSAANKLIEHGAGFYRGWARLLGAAAAGYTPSGEAAPLTVRGSLAMEG